MPDGMGQVGGGRGWTFLTHAAADRAGRAPPGRPATDDGGCKSPVASGEGVSGRIAAPAGSCTDRRMADLSRRLSLRMVPSPVFATRTRLAERGKRGWTGCRPGPLHDAVRDGRPLLARATVVACRVRCTARRLVPAMACVRARGQDERARRRPPPPRGDPPPTVAVRVLDPGRDRRGEIGGRRGGGASGPRAPPPPPSTARPRRPSASCRSGCNSGAPGASGPRPDESASSSAGTFRGRGG